MKTFILAALGIALAGTAFAAEASRARQQDFSIRLYGLAEHFEWKETMHGKQLLKESGPLWGFGGELAAKLAEPVWIEARGEFFLGDVDYDGHLQHKDGRLTPHKSTTSYNGFKLEGNLALRASASSGNYLKPYLGLGFRGWNRTLGTKLSDRYIGDYGYEERWLTAYGILGLGGAVAASEKASLFATIEAHLPIYNSETVDLENTGGPDDVELEPGKRASLYAEAGINATPITFSIFVETLSFSESDVDEDYRSFLQPKSESTMIGAKFGLVF